jgi:endoglucanase
MTKNALAGIAAVLSFAAFGCEQGPTLPFVSRETAPPAILTESWKAYVERFIQDDGRVIDHKASGISTSEGQAYAMLRAVWIGDRLTFDKTWRWALENLNSNIRTDTLWAWKWGRDADGGWGVLDKAFASDADQDAAFALILASRLWKDEKYEQQARLILRDLWNKATVEAGGRRMLLAGDSLCQGRTCRINPSYFSPYAYRLFYTLDPNREWMRLVDASYEALNRVSEFSSTQLPPDWALLDRDTGEIQPGSEKDGAFSYDAFRVHWRVALDRELYGEPRADEYLRRSLAWASGVWEEQKRLPAVISKTGAALVEYESLEMLAALMPALSDTSIHRRVQATYAGGAWGEKESYYLQNWAWFGTALYSGYLGPLEHLKNK